MVFFMVTEMKETVNIQYMFPIEIHVSIEFLKAVIVDIIITWANRTLNMTSLPQVHHPCSKKDMDSNLVLSCAKSWLPIIAFQMQGS